MSDAAPAPHENRARVTELKVTGHLMMLDPGLFCIQLTAAGVADPATGLPGVRVSLPPGRAGGSGTVEVGSCRGDGWLSGGGDAALVRISDGPAQVLVTIYAAPGSDGGEIDLQVQRLAGGAARPPAGRAAAAPSGNAPLPNAPLSNAPREGAPARAAARAPAVMDMVAHIQGRGDVGALLGEWLGQRGSKQWIEGFAVAPSHDVPVQDIEYQAVLGRGWLSPWAEGGQFCGSRGMALPVLGLRLRLRGASAEAYELGYSATFTDGSEIGPVGAGEPCEAESLAPMEAFQIELRPRRQPGQGAAAKGGAKVKTAKAAPKRVAAKPAAKPASGRGRPGR